MQELPGASEPGIGQVLDVGKLLESELIKSDSCSAAVPTDDTVSTKVVELVVPSVVVGNVTVVLST